MLFQYTYKIHFILRKIHMSRYSELFTYMGTVVVV